MNTAQKIESAIGVLSALREAEKNLTQTLSDVAYANALVAKDPSGEVEELEPVEAALNQALSTLRLEVFRWDTYLDNRE